jgi:hypothetical protein
LFFLHFPCPYKIEYDAVQVWLKINRSLTSENTQNVYEAKHLAVGVVRSN